MGNNTSSEANPSVAELSRALSEKASALVESTDHVFRLADEDPHIAQIAGRFVRQLEDKVSSLKQQILRVSVALKLDPKTSGDVFVHAPATGKKLIEACSAVFGPIAVAMDPSGRPVMKSDEKIKTEGTFFLWRPEDVHPEPVERDWSFVATFDPPVAGATTRSFTVGPFVTGHELHAMVSKYLPVGSQVSLVGPEGLIPDSADKAAHVDRITVSHVAKEPVPCVTKCLVPERGFTGRCPACFLSFATFGASATYCERCEKTCRPIAEKRHMKPSEALKGQVEPTNPTKRVHFAPEEPSKCVYDCPRVSGGKARSQACDSCFDLYYKQHQTKQCEACLRSCPK